MSEVRQIVSFLAQALYFGVDVLQVQEIIRDVAITPVPLAPPMISGLINIRGQIVTAMDMRRCLGLPERPSGQAQAGLILKMEEGLVGLIVDEIGTVFELPEDALAPSPEILKGRLRSLISRVYALPNQLLFVIEAERLLTQALIIDKSTDLACGSDTQVPSTSTAGSNATANENRNMQISESEGVQ